MGWGEGGEDGRPGVWKRGREEEEQTDRSHFLGGGKGEWVLLGGEGRGEEGIVIVPFSRMLGAKPDGGKDLFSTSFSTQAIISTLVRQRSN